MNKKLFHIFILIILSLFPVNTGAENNFKQVPIDHRVKAAFLCKFIKFMDWPSSRIVRNKGTFNIGVFGESPIAGNLFAIMPKEIDGWKLKIIKINDIKEALSSHMLFVSSSEEKRFPEIIELLKNESVLTVSDNPKFLEMGGIVKFFMMERKVRFEVNLEAAEVADIKISSQLLRLAKIFKAEPK